MVGGRASSKEVILKKLLLITMFLGVGFAGPFKVWNFQTPDQTYIMQQQYEYWNRAKTGNPQGYDYETMVNHFYVTGGFNVDTMNGSYSNQIVTNIGNINDIDGDGNTVNQTSTGDQTGTNDNTVEGSYNETLN